MDVKNNISVNISYLRKKKRLSQKDLAKVVGKKTSVISSYETGVSTPPIDVLQDISELFDININSLVNYQLDESNIDAHIKTNKNVHNIKKTNKNVFLEKRNSNTENSNYNLLIAKYTNYEKVQKSLINLCNLMYHEMGRNFSDEEKNSLYLVMTNIAPPLMAYIKKNGVDDFLKFTNERTAVAIELLNHFSQEYYKFKKDKLDIRNDVEFI